MGRILLVHIQTLKSLHLYRNLIRLLLFLKCLYDNYIIEEESFLAGLFGLLLHEIGEISMIDFIVPVHLIHL